MKIYQLHQFSGSGEEFCDIIIASYLSKEKAKEHLTELENKKQIEIERYKKCVNCPIDEELTKRKYNNPKVKQKIDNYCSEADIKFDEDNYAYCENQIWYYEPDNYKIISEDVIK